MTISPGVTSFLYDFHDLCIRNVAGSSTTYYLLNGDSIVKETNNSVVTNLLQSTW